MQKFKPLALFLLLLAPCREYSWVALHEVLRQADLVLVAEVVAIQKNEQGNPTVVVRPDSVLKSDCPKND